MRTEADAQLSRRLAPQERIVLIVYMVGLFMSVVDSTIIYTALPSVAREFHEPLGSAQWVTLGYLLALAVIVPCSGWIGDRFGTRRTYLTALILFTAASAGCGLAGSMLELVAFRIVQGFGGGLIVSVGQAMLFRTFVAERRAKASAIVALGTSLGPAIGPVLGGVLVTTLSWRWCFYVNLPLGIAVLVIGWLFLDEHRESAPGRLDVPGFLLAGGGLALCLYSLSELPARGWSSTTVISTGLGGVAALGVLVAVELRTPVPMLNLRLLRNRIFRTGTIASMLSGCSYTGYLFLMPEFLQQARGLSPLESGFTTFPGAIGLWIGSQLAARAYPHVGPRRMVVGSAAAVATIMSLYSVVLQTGTDLWLIRAMMLCSGFAISWCNLPLRVSSFSSISSADTGRASALFTTQSRVAGGVGVAVVVTVLTASGHHITGDAGALVPAFHHAFLTTAGLIAATGLVALRIRDSDAAASMSSRKSGSAPAPAASPTAQPEPKA
jgi:EmrB/QacA subfamily drug resistance transporter